jgi:peptide/nickel transport system ATP-binding protein
MAPVLEVTDLKTHFFTRGGIVKAVDGVTFKVDRGEVLGLVGESGSGKSVTGFSILGLIDPPGRIVSGSIKVQGVDVTGYDEAQWRTIRGRQVAMIFQDPMMTLNPVLRVDTQMIETLKAHVDVSEESARERCREALVQVGIAAPDQRLTSYPHQFSGGMRQRVAIAIALLHKPALIIADEPTTALDVTIQAQILAEVQKLAAGTGTALVWITHDLAIVSGLADRVAVMYAGRVVEEGATQDVLARPAHPYTRGLLESLPSRNPRGVPLAQIPGMTPNLLKLPAGCPFAPRCNAAEADCRIAPPEETRPLPDRRLRCFHPVLDGALA